MTATIAQARDDANALAKEAIEVLGIDGPIIVWDDKPAPSNAETADTWFRVKVRMLPTSAGGMGDGVRRYERSGLLWIMMHTLSQQGGETRDTYLESLLTSVEGSSTPRGLWFRDVKPVDGGRVGPHDQNSVMGTFLYDSIH